MLFTFMGKKYEVPDGADIEVFRFDDGCIDFDILIDGEAIAMFGGTMEDGSVAPTWEEVGIKVL